MNNIIIGTTNITDHIVADSYNMDADDLYESWRDGNYVEHRIITASKVRGSFEVACTDSGYSFTDLMTAINNADNNGVLTCAVFVTNKNEMKAISAYYAITNKKHELKADGSFVDVLEIELTER